MKKSAFLIVSIILLSSCGGKSTKKRSLDDTLFKYASYVRWSDYDSAVRFLKPDVDEIQPSSYELQHLKQFKVSRYNESPITPGKDENSIQQRVEIQLYNIHTNKIRDIIDKQVWEYNAETKQWFLISGIPKI